MNYEMRLPMNTRGMEIFIKVLDEMQEAEERNGVEGRAYIFLMQAIIEEATERLVACSFNYIPEGE